MSDALDTLCELLARFGGLLPAEQMARVQALALGYLGESKAALRKKAMHCLGEGGGCRPWPWGVGQCRHTISAVKNPILLSPPPPFPQPLRQCTCRTPCWTRPWLSCRPSCPPPRGSCAQTWCASTCRRWGK